MRWNCRAKYTNSEEQSNSHAVTRTTARKQAVQEHPARTRFSVANKRAEQFVGASIQQYIRSTPYRPIVHADPPIIISCWAPFISKHLPVVNHTRTIFFARFSTQRQQQHDR